MIALYTKLIDLEIFQLIEFNDTMKTGKLEDQSPEDIKTYDLKHFNWTRDLVDKNEKTAVIRLIGDNFTLENTSLTGTINLTVYFCLHIQIEIIDGSAKI